MASHICLVPPDDPPDYSTGYIDGLRDGEKWARTRLFWLGLVAGVLLAFAVALIVAATYLP